MGEKKEGKEGEKRCTLSVEPDGPTIRCRRLVNRSLFRMRFPILMMSHATSSWKIFAALLVLSQHGPKKNKGFGSQHRRGGETRRRRK